MLYYQDVIKTAEVEIEKVNFPNQQINLVGNIFKPKKFSKDKYSAIVIGHPSGGVKEQTAGVYAALLAEKGFLTLAFDASYQGESGGEPRYLESPAARVEDMRCAVDYLTTRNDVDADNIGILGMCASGGYCIKAAETDLRIKAVATVSMADLGDLFRNGLERNMTEEARKKFLSQISAQRTKEANGAPIFYIGYVPNSEEETVGKQNDYREGYEYYRVSPAKHERSVNKMIFSRLDAVVNFTALDNVKLIAPRPLLIIAGTEANTKYFAEETFNKAEGEKTLHWIQGATHIQLYYVKKYVLEAIAELNKFYGDHLK
ncbi:MAG: alpha/beta hydrolase [Selenomonadaceae bacterium]|nr:alpha/beta hydrolase [Selenomonadaceae bacterium]